MELKPIKKKLKLYGFNNLTKSLSFNFYDICYTRFSDDSKAYIEYIDEEYNATRLTEILTNVSNIIGATILNIAEQDYDPQGASVTMLISEGDDSNIEPESVVAHLDKSHIAVHTYPETHPEEGISTFRADIDVSTCGKISPLKALNYLIDSFCPDIAVLDYRVRGFTRQINGKKIFIDHKINSIQDYMTDVTKDTYRMVDINVYQDNIFNTKMSLKKLKLSNSIFGLSKEDMLPGERKRIRKLLQKEMNEIYSGKTL